MRREIAPMNVKRGQSVRMLHVCGCCIPSFGWLHANVAADHAHFELKYKLVQYEALLGASDVCYMDKAG